MKRLLFWGCVFFQTVAMDFEIDAESLKRYRGDEQRDDIPLPFKKQKTGEFFNHINILSKDIWQGIAYYLERMDYSSLRCVNSQIDPYLSSGYGLVYRHSFDEEVVYLEKLMNRYPLLKLELDCTSNEKIDEKLEGLSFLKAGGYFSRLQKLVIGCSLLKRYYCFFSALDLSFLKEIDIMGEDFSDDAVEFVNTKLFDSFLINQLESFSSEAYFSNIQIENKHHKKWEESIFGENKNLKFISFKQKYSGNRPRNLDISFLEGVAKRWSQNLNLVKIDFTQTGMTNKYIPVLLKVMENAPKMLTTIILDRNSFGMEGIFLILQKNKENLEKNKGVQKLSFINVMDEDGEDTKEQFLGKLYELLASDNVIKDLSLGGRDFFSSLGDGCFFSKPFFQALNVNNALKFLTLYAPDFFREANTDFFQFLGVNKTLEYLAIDFNSTENQRKSLLENLQHNTSLLGVDFDEQSQKEFGEVGRRSIKSIMHRNFKQLQSQKETIDKKQLISIYEKD